MICYVLLIKISKIRTLPNRVFFNKVPQWNWSKKYSILQIKWQWNQYTVYHQKLCTLPSSDNFDTVLQCTSWKINWILMILLQWNQYKMGQHYLNCDKKHGPTFKNPLSNWYTRSPRNNDRMLSEGISLGVA